MDRLGGLVVIAPAGDPGSNPGPGETFSLKLLMYDLSEGYSKAKISSKLTIITFVKRKLKLTDFNGMSNQKTGAEILRTDQPHRQCFK